MTRERDYREVISAPEPSARAVSVSVTQSFASPRMPVFKSTSITVLRAAAVR